MQLWRLLNLPTTHFASLTRPRAIGIIVLWLTLLTGLLLTAHIHPNPLITTRPATRSDAQTYRAVVDRLHAGEGYYEALGAELRAGGYGTRSIFNWRPPLGLWMLGHLPSIQWAQALLAMLAASAYLLIVISLLTEPYNSPAGAMGKYPCRSFALAAISAVLLLLSLVGYLAPSSVYFMECWASTLILLSIGAFALNWRGLGIAAGLAALFFRELAFPYLLVCIFIAWRQRRRTELLAWTSGLALYAVYFSLHALAVIHHLSPADQPDQSHWLQFGGLRFLLTTASAFGPLIGRPAWQAAAFLALAILGLAGWRGPVGQRIRLTVALYLLFFACVGKPFNWYWGFLYAPLLALGAAQALPAIRDLFRSLSS